MKQAETIRQVREQISRWKGDGLSIGLVPTMGYLHEGHESLIAASVQQNDRTVVSVFVNPMQFGPSEDLQAYPRDLQRDAALCEAAGAALLFHPQPEEMYAPDFCSFVDMTGLTEGLCGKSRPTHFRGVCTVVMKLFQIVQPDRAYFGQKDAQQLAVIRRMVRDLDVPVEIVGCPIVREADGLAKSSRNSYLSVPERRAAPVLYRALCRGRELLEQGERDADRVARAVREVLEQEPLARIDYVSVVDAGSLQPVSAVERDVLVALAVYIGNTRLIDNITCQIS